MESSSKIKLKDRLAKVFRRSSLLRATCSPSSTPLNNGTSGNKLGNEIVKEPQFFPSSRRYLLHDHLDRSLSFPIISDDNNSLYKNANQAAARRLSLDRGGCRSSRYSYVKKGSDNDTKVKKNKKKEKKGKDNVLDGRSYPPASPSSRSKSCYDDYYCCFNDVVKEKNDSSRSFKCPVRNDGIKVKKKLISNPYGFTSSSDSMTDGDDEFGFFSSEEKEAADTETLLSSKSFSSDSSEFYQLPLSKKNKSRSKKDKKKQQQEQTSYSHRQARIRSSRDGFQPVVSVEKKKRSTSVKSKGKSTTAAVVHGKEKEKMERGFPVVKQTTDPYSDFRNSMVEMIVERQMFSADQLEKLLHCYISLNSTRHHPAILQAFSDICDVLFAY